MGRDKSLLIYNGKPQREFVFELLKRFCSEVYTSCRSDQNIPGKLNPLPDRFEIAGPMNGILTAFNHRPVASWLIIAVDMPYVNEDTVHLLIRSHDEKKIATCFYNPETRQPEPLLTLWNPKANVSLLEFTEKGNVSPREFLKRHDINLIQPPDAKTLLNLNSPEDLPESTRTPPSP